MIVSSLAAGVVVGALSALFGIGGSVLMVPFMTMGLDMSQHASEGTALLVVVPTAVVGVVAHSRRGYVDFGEALFMAAGGIFGAYVGARLALSVSGESLKTVFGVFLCGVGLRMAWRGFRGDRVSNETA